MWHRIVLVAVLVGSILTGSCPPVWAQGSLCTVYVDGVKVAGYPLMKDGTAYLPTHVLAEALGVSIGWDPRLNVVKVNGQVVATPPLNEQGRLYLPVESLANAVGGQRGVGTGEAASFASPPRDGGVAVAPVSTPTTTYSVPTVSVPRVVSPTVTVAPTTPVVTSPAGTWPAPGTSTVIPPSHDPPNVSSLGPFDHGVGALDERGERVRRFFRRPTARWAIRLHRRIPARTPAPLPCVRPAPQIKMPAGLELPPVQTDPSQSPSNAGDYDHSHGAGVCPQERPEQRVRGYGHQHRDGGLHQGLLPSQARLSLRPSSTCHSRTSPTRSRSTRGDFSLLDQNNRAYDYIEGLSNFWLVILRPYGINFGYLVFEVPHGRASHAHCAARPQPVAP